MIVTEEEAKTKRCQEGYAASPGAALNPTMDYVHQTVSVPSVQSAMFGAGAAITATTAAPMTAPIMCLGSACMAWRWAQWEDSGEYGRPRGNPIAGYCGKAGRP